MPAIDTLTGDFTNSSVWTKGAGFTTTKDPTRLDFLNALGTTMTTSTVGWDLTGKSFSWKLAEIAGALDFGIELRDNGGTTNYYRWASGPSGSHLWTFYKNGVVINTITDTVVRANPYQRYRETGGNTVIEGSPDGVTWTPFSGITTANLATLTNFQVAFVPVASTISTDYCTVQQVNGTAAPAKTVLQKIATSVLSAGSWATTTNALANDSAVATSTGATVNTEYPLDLGGYDFSAIPAGSTINAVRVTAVARTANTARSQWKLEALDGATSLGVTTLAAYRSTTDVPHLLVATPTLAQLQSAGFIIRFTDKRINATANTSSLNSVLVAVDYTLPSTPVAIARYKLDETSGSTAADSAGSHPLTLTKGYTWPGDGLQMGFDGLGTTAPFSLNLPAATILGWVKPTLYNASNSNLGFGFYHSNQNTGFAVYLERSDFSTLHMLSGQIRTASGLTPIDATRLPVGVWAKVAFVYDGTRAWLVVDGAEVASAAKSGSITSTELFTVGAFWNECYAVFKDLQVFDSALTLAQIATAMGGVAAKTGTSAGAITWAGTSAGKRTPKGSSTTGAITWAGSSAGKRTPKGSSTTGAVAWAGTSAGKRTPIAVGTGAFSFSGAASGTAPAVGVKAGTSSGAIAWAGAAAGKRTPKAGTVGTITWGGTASGKRAPKAIVTGAVGWAGGAAGKRTPKALATGAFSFYGGASGYTPVIGARTGISSGTLTWAGSAVGRRAPKAGSAGLITWTGTVVGKRVQRGAGVGAFDFTGGATGRRITKAIVTGAVQLAGAATGQRAPRAIVIGAMSFVGTAYSAPEMKDITVTVGAGVQQHLDIGAARQQQLSAGVASGYSLSVGTGFRSPLSAGNASRTSLTVGPGRT